MVEVFRFSPSKIGMGKGKHSKRGVAAYQHTGNVSFRIERGIAARSIEVLILLSDRFRKSVDWTLRGEED
jgi:hypothetical protein